MQKKSSAGAESLFWNGMINASAMEMEYLYMCRVKVCEDTDLGLVGAKGFFLAAKYAKASKEQSEDCIFIISAFFAALR